MLISNVFRIRFLTFVGVIHINETRLWSFKSPNPHYSETFQSLNESNIGQFLSSAL